MSHKTPTVCVVDDEPSVCKALRRLMMSAGFNVITYGSAQAFLDDYKAKTPDLLILDVRMPGMSGLDLQDHLIGGGCRTPIVFITAYENHDVLIRAMGNGAAAFFQKPVDEVDLLGAIHKSLGLARQSG
jgi:two-component system, LuxR family, response regulator FixJ